jgi:hypothetical protein
MGVSDIRRGSYLPFSSEKPDTKNQLLKDSRKAFLKKSLKPFPASPAVATP